MRNAIRTISRWCPFRAFSEMFEDWAVEIVEGMHAAERIIPISRTVMLDRDMMDRDPYMMMAHAYGHLVLHYDFPGGTYSDKQEDEADDLAELMLDREDWPLIA